MADIFDTVEQDVFDEIETDKTNAVINKAKSYSERRLAQDDAEAEERRASGNPIVGAGQGAMDYLLPQALSGKQFKQDEFNIYGDVGERIPGFIRGAIQPESSAIQGFMRPSTVPTSGQYIYLKQGIQPTGNKVVDFVKAYPASFAGEALDMAMNPFTYIGGALGKSKALAKEAGKFGVKAVKLASNVSNFLKPVTSITGRGVRNIRLTFGSPMRNFRKFVAKQDYDEVSLRNLPIKDQVIAQKEHARKVYAAKESALTQKSEKVAENIGRTKESRQTFEEFGKAVKQDISLKREALKKTKQSDFALQKINDKNARLTIQDNLKILDDELDRVTQQGAEDIQPLLKDFFKANSTAYGQRYDKYSELLDNSNKPLTVNTAYGLTQQVTDKLDEMQVINSKGRRMIDKLKADYEMYNAERELIKNPNDVVKFKEFNQKVRDVMKTLSDDLVKGERVTQDDLALISMHEVFGNYIAENVGAFKDLQQAYRPVINGMKEAGKQFKPFASEFQKTPGAAFLKKAALGKQAPQEARVLELMQQGTEFAPGIGNVSLPAKAIGQKLLSQESMLEQLKRAQKVKFEEMTARFTKQFNALDEGEMEVNRLMVKRAYELTDQINALEKGKMTIDKMISLNKANSNLRALQLAERKIRIDKLVHIKRKAMIIKAAIAGVASAPTGIPQSVGRWAVRSLLGDTAANK